ncbi:MAG: rod shape-determining protein MreD [Rhodothermia bacterium]|nr:MAG: rod shape-determining protein MreD [Rhodothermia bacterium]
MSAVIRTIALGAAVMAIQWLVLGRITLWGAYPDAVLLYVTVVGIRYGRQAGAISGFAAGFVMDAIYDTWGLHMLVKTLVGFLVGFFPAAERETLIILPRQAFLGGLVIALVHNGLFVTLLALQAGVRNTFLVTGLWLGSAVYTACVATLVSFFGTK